jgi:pimeloyl-ACP methyl ester carboxylesterase
MRHDARTALSIALIGSLGLCATCARRGQQPGSSSPAKPCSREVAARQSSRFLALMVENKYEQALALATDDLRRALPAPQFKQAWEGVQAKAGRYQKPVTTSYIVYQGSHIVDTVASFALTPLTIRISVDGAGRVEGLFFRPASLERPQHPKPPFPYAQREVKYKNSTDGSTIAGTLTLPREKGLHPAALLITGSGLQDRDETIAGHKPFLVLADHLTRRGIAVLRVDDRGIGGSTGDPKRATPQVNATDVAAGAAFLRAQPEVDPKRVGLIGHSEGGIIAPLVASQSKEIAFIVSLAGTGLPGAEINLAQMEILLRATPGFTDEERARLTAAQKKIIELIKADADDDALAAAIRAASEIQHKAASKAELDTAIADATRQAGSPWFRAFAKLDPREAWRKVSCPVLALNGEKDTQVPADANLAAIAKALADGGNKDVTTRKLPALNHLFQTSKTGMLDEYAQIEETFHAPALDLIASWIRERMLKR